jgi:GDP-L-fucose synthase
MPHVVSAGRHTPIKSLITIFIMTESSVSFSSSTTSSDKRIILVTGGSGLVGQNLRSLIASSSSSVLPSSSSSIPPGGMTEEGEEYIFLTSKDADLRNRDETFQLFAKYKPYAVIHLAAFVGGLFKNLRFPVEFYR